MRFKLPYLWYRLMGIVGICLIIYIIVIGIFGRIDVSWLMPNTNQMAQNLIEVWPRMPFFSVDKQPVEGSSGQEIYYTVPTRQFTPQELARMGRPKPDAGTKPVPK